MDVLIHWGAIEADFQRFYNISHPHKEEYKRFLRLLVNMPMEESTFMKIMSNEQLDVDEEGKIVPKNIKDTQRLKHMLRNKHGRDTKPRQRVTLDEFMKDTRGIK